MKKTLIRLLISNAAALMVFSLMYIWGVNNIPGVKEYSYIPLTVLLGYLIVSDYKELKRNQEY